MPEGAPASAGRPLRELSFVAVPPDLRAGEAHFDCTTDAPAVARAQGLAWRDLFVDWLGGLNRANASLSWWAYTSTAKNLLSSPLGDACLGALALEAFLGRTDAPRVYVTGATPALVAAMGERLDRTAWDVTGARTRLPVLEPLARLAWQFSRMLALWISGKLRMPAGEAPEAMIFTYVDGSFRGPPDPFFGTLAQQLPVRTRYAAFVHSAYGAALPKLRASGYEPLFGSLRLADLLWTLKASLCAWWKAGRCNGGTLDGRSGDALLRHALRWDLGRGGYFYNLLVHRAALRLLAYWRPRWLIYPYENKALEKMLLLATRTASPETRVVGYQHTSITRRHATFLFAAGEAAATPLPERVVTVGEVTRRYLEGHGRYPRGIFVTGCAMRQQRGTLLERREVGSGKLRLLLALSSSRRELVQSVDFCRRALEAHAGFELGVRPHPEFPLSLLPLELRDWLGHGARDLTGTALGENLQWCDIVAYVSSSVALEALARGRPVINLAISDPLDPDPVLDSLAFHWTAQTPAALPAATREIAALDADEFERRRADALRYIDDYLRAPHAQALRAFLPA